MAERVYRDDAGAVTVMLYTTPAPHVVWLDWRCDPGVLDTPAVDRAIRWAFDAGYHRVETGIPVTDAAALRTATSVGLRREGVSRRGAFDRGEQVDLIRLGRLAQDVDPTHDPLPTLAAGFHRTLTASGLFVSDPDDRVLLLRTSYKADWEIPGGLGEPGEGPLATVRREVREELGLELFVGDLLLVDASPATERRADLLAMIFDGGVQDPALRDTLRFPDGEILGAAWADAATVRARCSSLLANRLTRIMSARARGRLPGPPMVLK